MEETVLKESRVACLTTTSLKEVMDLFLYTGRDSTYLITELRAFGSKAGKDKPDVSDEGLNITGYNGRKTSFFDMKYKIDFDDEGRPKNPIDDDARNKILDYFSDLSMKGAELEDVAVDRVSILMRDPKIGELAGGIYVDEEMFHCYLESDPVDGKTDRDFLKQHNVNIALAKEQKFKYRILQCHRLIPRSHELMRTKAEQKPIIQWRGNTVYSLDSPIKTAQRLKEHFGEYKALKKYGEGTEDTLVLLGISR